MPGSNVAQLMLLVMSALCIRRAQVGDQGARVLEGLPELSSDCLSTCLSQPHCCLSHLRCTPDLNHCMGGRKLWKPSPEMQQGMTKLCKR